MESYRLNDKIMGKKEKRFIWITPILGVLIFVGNSFDLDKLHLKTTLLGIPIAAVIIFIMARRSAKKTVETWRSYLLELDDKVMIQSQLNTERVVIAFSEVTKIIGYREGISIETNEKLKKIFISKDLEAYEEVISKIKSRSGLTVREIGTINQLFQQITLPIFLMVSLCIFCISADKVAVVVTGVYIIAYLSWFIFTIRESIIDFSYWTPGGVLTGIIAVLYIASRIYYVLMY